MKRIGLVALAGLLAVPTFAAVDYTAAGTSLTTGLTAAIEAALPIIAALFAAVVGVKLFFKLARGGAKLHCANRRPAAPGRAAGLIVSNKGFPMSTIPPPTEQQLVVMTGGWSTVAGWVTNWIGSQKNRVWLVSCICGALIWFFTELSREFFQFTWECLRMGWPYIQENFAPDLLGNAPFPESPWDLVPARFFAIWGMFSQPLALDVLVGIVKVVFGVEVFLFLWRFSQWLVSMLRLLKGLIFV